MSIKYLNLSGLEDLWINIKNYILSKIPTKTSELTNDSGYLTSHQSLDNYVTLNSGQTITAIKTITGGNQGKMLFKNPNYTKGNAVESGTTISRLYFGNGTSYGAANGVLTTDISSAGNTSIELCAMNNTASSSYRASLIITYDKSATSPRLLKSWGNFVPYSSDNYTLGNSSSIWKECYCNAYYLGTTAFGDIVTHNASEFLTSHQSLANYVTTNTDQDIAGDKNFKGLITTIPNETLWPATTNTTADITSLGGSSIHIEYKSSGKLTDLSGGAWNVVELGEGCFFFRINNGTDIRFKHFPTNTVNRIPVVSGANRFINDVTPNENNTYSLGTSSLRWKACYSNAYYLGTTAFGDIVTHNASEFLTSHQSLANYVTTNTDQSISGIKSHSKHISILGDYIGNEFSTNARTCLYLKSNRDTDGKSGIYFSKFRQNVAQGALTGSNLVSLTLDVLENSVRTNNCISIDFRYFENDVPTKIYVIPKKSATSYMGTSDNPWTNAYITNLNLNGNAFDPTSIDGVGTTKLLAYEPASASDYGSTLAGTTKPGSSLYDVSMDLLNATGYYGDFNSGSGEFIVSINARNPQSGTWKILHNISVSAPQSGARSFAISMWVRIA